MFCEPDQVFRVLLDSRFRGNDVWEGFPLPAFAGDRPRGHDVWEGIGVHAARTRSRSNGFGMNARFAGGQYLCESLWDRSFLRTRAVCREAGWVQPVGATR